MKRCYVYLEGYGVVGDFEVDEDMDSQDVTENAEQILWDFIDSAYYYEVVEKDE